LKHYRSAVEALGQRHLVSFPLTHLSSQWPGGAISDRYAAQPARNLSFHMARRNFTPADRVALAQAWAEARAHGERQEEFAARSGVSARRVRQFAREHGVVEVPVEQARQLIVDAIEQLQRLLAGIDDQVVQGARRAARGEHQQDAPEEAARRPSAVHVDEAARADDRAGAASLVALSFGARSSDAPAAGKAGTRKVFDWDDRQPSLTGCQPAPVGAPPGTLSPIANGTEARRSCENPPSDTCSNTDDKRPLSSVFEELF